MVLDFLAVDNFDFTRKIVKKNLGGKLVKMLGFCQNSIFGQKFDFSNSVLLYNKITLLRKRKSFNQFLIEVHKYLR